MSSRETVSWSLAQQLVRALDEKKAGDLRILDVSEQSSITNFMIIATATSEPHLRALRVELEKVLDSQKTHIVGMDTAEESGWTVIDAFDVMVHLFTEERRDLYKLENLWKDAEDVTVDELMERKPKKTVKKAPKKPMKKAAKKPANRKASRKGL
jgi:ribosome-associated protein